MSEARQALAHLAAVAVLVFLLGFDIYSLSIDVAHHFMQGNRVKEIML